MQKLDREILYSATDVTHFAECSYRTWLDRLDLDVPQQKVEDDEYSRPIQGKGIAHEVSFLEQLRSAGRAVVEIAPRGSLEARVERTRDAVREGADVIYQAMLRRGNEQGSIQWTGTTGFLLRSEPPTARP